MTSFAELNAIVADRLARNQRTRRDLDDGGRLRIERQLPFLCVYRQPTDRPDPGTAMLVTSEAAYLQASGDVAHAAEVSQLVRTIIETLHEHFGAFLVIELWTLPDETNNSGSERVPRFELVVADPGLPATVEKLRKALADIRLFGAAAEVRVAQQAQIAPPNMPPLLESFSAKMTNCACVGLAVRPIFRSSAGVVFPLVLQTLKRQLGPAIRKAVYAFAGNTSRQKLASYQSLGPAQMGKSARLVDQQLCDIAQSFDFVLQVTPVNAAQAWASFQASKFERPPRLRYRPLPYHPSLLKRQLFEIPIEDVEDVTLAHLFWEKQDELDRQLTALRDLETPAFRYSSIQLYGAPSRELVELARSLVALQVPPDATAECDGKRRQRRMCVNAQEVADRARKEIGHYHQQHAAFAGTVHFNERIASGIMVAKDQLLIDPRLKVPVKRVAALLHHEIGTHLLTYFNGRAQPLQQLYAGCPGYESLQEGLAVLAEYLTGGLSPARVRHLAARVLAVHAQVEGATFVETFRLLHDTHQLGKRLSFDTTLRAFRGGGLTKDAIYLGGFSELLAYLNRGHDLEPLYVGKIALSHITAIQELRLRGIVQPPALLPRFWSEDGVAKERLKHCRTRSVAEILTQDVPRGEPEPLPKPKRRKRP